MSSYDDDLCAMGYFVLICGFICWSLVHELASAQASTCVVIDRATSHQKESVCIACDAELQEVRDRANPRLSLGPLFSTGSAKHLR